jgi:hypothetical protein
MRRRNPAAQHDNGVVAARRRLPLGGARPVLEIAHQQVADRLEGEDHGMGDRQHQHDRREPTPSGDAQDQRQHGADGERRRRRAQQGENLEDGEATHSGKEQAKKRAGPVVTPIPARFCRRKR